MSRPSTAQLAKTRRVTPAEQMGVTVMSAAEPAGSSADLCSSPHGVAFSMDAVAIQPYLEIDGKLRRAMAAAEVHASQHGEELRAYESTPEGGVTVGQPLEGCSGLLTGAVMAGAGRLWT